MERTYSTLESAGSLVVHVTTTDVGLVDVAWRFEITGAVVSAAAVALVVVVVAALVVEGVTDAGVGVEAGGGETTVLVANAWLDDGGGEDGKRAERDVVAVALLVAVPEAGSTAFVVVAGTLDVPSDGVIGAAKAGFFLSVCGLASA